MKLRVIKAGSKLLITDQNDAAKKFIAAAHKAGDSATEKGVSTWVVESEVIDTTKTGVEMYTWHKDGNRVKVRRELVTKYLAGGTMTRKFLGFAWRTL